MNKFDMAEKYCFIARWLIPKKERKTGRRAVSLSMREPNKIFLCEKLSETAG